VVEDIKMMDDRFVNNITGSLHDIPDDEVLTSARPKVKVDPRDRATSEHCNR